MANFPKHLPVQWELFRNEPLKAQVRQEALRHQIEEIDKGRGESDGLWWPDQRYVDVVVPAEYVDPDSLDTFNYRYQVFARPPPIQCPPRCLAEVSEEKPPVSYNVKRIAQCKPLETALPQCMAHWESRPFALTQPCHGVTDLPGQSQNNNSCVERRDALAAADQASPDASQHISCANQPAFIDQSEALPTRNKWLERCNTATPLKEEISQHRNCFATRIPSQRMSAMASMHYIRDANRNKGLEDYALETCQTSTTGSPRSCCSYSSCAASIVHNHNDTGESKTRTNLRLDHTQGTTTLPELTSETASEFGECNRVRSDNGRVEESLSQANAIDQPKLHCMDTMFTKVGESKDAASNYDCNLDEKQQPLNNNSFIGSQSFTKDVVGADEPRAVSVGSEVANNANNNERNPFIGSRTSLYTPVKVAQSLEGKSHVRPMGLLSARAPHAENVQSLLCGKRMDTKCDGMAVGRLRPVGRLVKRGRRFGYNVPALKDNIARLVFESNEAGSIIPPVPKKSESKPGGLNTLPQRITVGSLINNACFPTQSETTPFKNSTKSGKRMGYQIGSAKDSIVFGGGHTKELVPLHHGGVRRSCEIGRYRSMANSDNMRSLIFSQNVNGNSSAGRADGREDPEPESTNAFDQRKVIVDIFILEGELDQPTSSTGIITLTEYTTVDPGIPILPSDLAVPGCTNNNSAITDPILDIQLDRKCMLQARQRAETTDGAPSPADNYDESTTKDGRGKPEIPYESYKIIGGKQNKSRPPEDLLSELQLPPQLAEYQEFIRRCPNYNLGRYDRSDPANEMLLPGSKSMNTLRMTMNPFMYSRNPNVGKIPPLFYTTTGNTDLKWPLTASQCHGDHASQSMEE